MINRQLRWLSRFALIFMAGTILIIVLVKVEIFDPKPLGQNILQEDLPQMTLDAASKKIQWLDYEVPNPPYSIRLTASYAQGEEDIAYGLILGNEISNITTAISPLGYLALLETEESGAAFYHLNWQSWPHVQSGPQQNEIWLDIAGNKAQVRVNREWLWEGNINIPGSKIGIMGESYGDSSVIEFHSIEIFAADDDG